MAAASEHSISVRLVWPFARVSGSTEGILRYLERAAASFADPDGRIPRSVAMELCVLQADAIPDIGLRAAALTEAQDLVLEYAARSAPTLGDAAHCLIRYSRVMDDAADMSLDAEGEHAVWRFRLKGGLGQPAAANDFALATAIAFSRRNVSIYEPPVEVHFVHDEPSYASRYERVFEAPVRFGAECNAIVIRRERLAVPMLRANPNMARAFERRAEQLIERLEKSEGLMGTIRRGLLEQLPRGPVSMPAIAESQGIAVATLRRRLRDEGTTFESILEEVRRSLATEYLKDPELNLTEIAFLLGYGNVTSFTRAFQRWTGTTPALHRTAMGEPGRSSLVR
jgi:AraC-like DNA-binding protein